MTSKKLKKTFTAAFLSGSILLQNFPALAAASDTTDWLKESPFRQDITTEKSTPTESVPSETETVSPETLSTFQTEAETEAEMLSVLQNNWAIKQRKKKTAQASSLHQRSRKKPQKKDGKAGKSGKKKQVRRRR